MALFRGLGSSKWAFLALPQSRRMLAGRWARSLGMFLAAIYGLASLLLGGMLVLARTGRPSTTITVYLTPYSPSWWNFPAVVVVAPGGVLAISLLAAVAMTLVALGVGVGMSIGLILIARVIRGRRPSSGGPAVATLGMGLTPAVLAALTVGACCSVTASGAAGLEFAGSAAAVGLFGGLAGTWALWAFQLVVLSLALLAQEKLLEVTRTLPGPLETPPEELDSVATGC